MTTNSYTSPSRLGFHYFPDTLHYRSADIHAWLPVLQGVGAGWLVLRSEATRAIPESFLRALVQARIEPVIQFSLAPESVPEADRLSTLFDVYARWGARYVVLFDKPNARASWPGAGWAQQDLVERFLDRYLPAAGLAASAGLQPVFPPLAPGGSYWDTAFLRGALEAMQRRKCTALLDGLVLSAYAWTANQPLDWGAGGPERWPDARPYRTPEGSQDQRGFRIFDWYMAAARAALGQDRPVILFQAGLPGAPETLPAAATRDENYTRVCLEIARLLDHQPARDGSTGTDLEPLPPQVISANFWLLSAAKGTPAAAQAWFPEDGPPHPLAARLQAYRRQLAERRQTEATPAVPGKAAPRKPIAHYLLLPGADCADSDAYLELARPLIKKYRPTVGFSPSEAERAARVTIVGSARQHPAGLVERLRAAGCLVEQIRETGTEIASTPVER